MGGMPDMMSMGGMGGMGGMPSLGMDDMMGKMMSNMGSMSMNSSSSKTSSSSFSSSSSSSILLLKLFKIYTSVDQHWSVFRDGHVGDERLVLLLDPRHTTPTLQFQLKSGCGLLERNLPPRLVYSLYHHAELIPCLHDGFLSLLMGHLEHIFASNRDQEVIGRESNLGCQAVFGHL